MSREPSVLIWALETDEERFARRYVLCQLDGLLGLVEQHNFVHGGETPVPGRLVAQYMRLGGARLSPPVGGALLLDAIFTVQTRYTRLSLREWLLRQESHDPERLDVSVPRLAPPPSPVTSASDIQMRHLVRRIMAPPLLRVAQGY